MKSRSHNNREYLNYSSSELDHSRIMT